MYSLLLLFSILFLFISIWCITYSKNYYIWLLTIIATEWSFLFLLISFNFLIVSVFNSFYFPFVIFFIASIFFSRPLYSYWILKSKIELNFRSVFQYKLKLNLRFFDLLKISTKYAHSELLTFDKPILFYRGNSNEKSPCIILIHGGGWNSGLPSDLSGLNKFFNENGIHVMAISYGLAPVSIYPSQLVDIKNSLEYISTNADKYLINMDQLFLMGRSAGAQLAQLYGSKYLHPSFKGIIALYSPADLVWGWQISTVRWVLDSRKLMTDFIGFDYENKPDMYYDASPLNHITNQTPPMLLIHGLNDRIVAPEHNHRLIIKLEKYKVPYFLVQIPYGTHGFDYNPYGISGQLTKELITGFINSFKQ